MSDYLALQGALFELVTLREAMFEAGAMLKLGRSPFDVADFLQLMAENVPQDVLQGVRGR